MTTRTDGVGGDAAAAGIGLRALKGGAVAVAVAIEAGAPRLLFSTFLPTAADGDRLSSEPYRVAHDMPRGADGKASAEAVAAVAEGRARQDALASEGLAAIVERLAKTGHSAAVAALLVNRAGWITDLLDYSLGWADHVPVAETLAVRDALRFGIARCGLAIAEVDETSLPAMAGEMLGLSAPDIEARLKTLGVVAGKPWRKEQKAACLAAWASLARLGGGGA